jgi:chromosome partitioning protein
MNSEIQFISVWSPKGGVGKTSLSINLADCFHTYWGYSVAVIDLEPRQQSATWIHQRGKLAFPILTGMPDKKPDAKVVILDFPPWMDEQLWVYLKLSKYVIIPIRPSALDYAAITQAIQDYKIEQENFEIIRVLNCLDSRRSEERAVEHALKQTTRDKVAVVKNRSIYPKVIGSGLGVFSAKGEIEKSNNQQLYEAQAEIDNLTRLINVR